jgi:chitodextrinase
MSTSKFRPLSRLFNKSRFNVAVSSAAAAVALVAGAVLLSTHAAGVGVLSLSPATANVSLGSTVTVTILENSSTTSVNSVEADLTYDQSKLQFVSVSTSTSPFTLVARATGGSGSVLVGSATTTPVSGQQTVAVVTFTAIGTGNAPISFSATSGLAESTNNTDILGSTVNSTITIKDNTSPSTPTSLSVGTRTATSISFSWNASTDNVGVTGYTIYRNGTPINTTTSTNYTDSGLTPSTSYSYRVAAYDAAGNDSAQSTALSTSTTADTTKPSVPTGLSAGTRTVTSIAFSWSASTDNVAVTGYKIYRDGTQIATTASRSYTDNGLTPGSPFSYTVAAYDAAGNTSLPSTALSTATLADSTAPTVPTGLSASNITSSSVRLSWTASTDNVGVAGYNVYRDNVKIASTVSTNYTDTGLSPGATYTYTIAAYDSVNTSAKSSGRTVTTLVVPGDANGDGHVDMLDLSILATSWLSSSDLRADFNHDNIVNFLDLSIMASNWEG